MARVSLQRLRKSFGATVAVADFSLDIDEGELVAFLGPSGCGKTTTLRMIAGFITPTAGRILIGDTDVTTMPPHRRNTGMVFQRYALFPHITVAQNVAFGLEMRKVPAGERDARISRTLDMVRMTELRDRMPRQLSGGQQQRVAIARALAIEPGVFLLDEPLSNLDAKLRLEVREEIRALQQRLALTTIFVTHDQDEALAISDRMAIMHDGIVQQVGTPEALYERPDNLFVADFLGKMNFFRGRLDAPGRFVSDKGSRILIDTAPDGTRCLGLRPERMTLVDGGRASQPNSLPGVVLSVVYLGAIIDVRVELDTREVVSCRFSNAPAAGRMVPVVGQRVDACFAAHDCVAFSEAPAERPA